MYDYGNWLMVALNIFIFYYFIKESFKPTTKVDWMSFRMIMAFIVALFAEMYGFPLTIYLLTSYFGSKIPNLNFAHDNGHLLNTLLGIKGDPHFSVLHIISNVFIIGGIFLISQAWKTLYTAQKDHALATSGVYKYLRHPQYAAFILIIIGFLLQWPTFITLIMAPILIVRYVILAKSEEKQMLHEHSKSYQIYHRETPGFFPSIGHLLKTVLTQKSSPGIQ